MGGIGMFDMNRLGAILADIAGYIAGLGAPQA